MLVPFQGTPLLVSCLIAAALFVSSASGGQSAPQRETLLAPRSFDAALSGWKRQAEAEFGPDPAVAHDGLTAARIRVGAGVKLAYQQLQYDVTQGVREGDEFSVSSWVRTEGVSDGTGAYLALEFVGAGGERVGIAHSKLDVATGKTGWEQLSAGGPAPAGTRAIRLSLILHAHGTAWFAGPEIVRTGRMEPWPDLGATTRAVTVHADRVIQPGFGGVGFHAFHHSFTWSDADMDEVIYKRWNELRPSFARINHENKWDRAKLDDVARHILRMKAAGTQVYVTTWDPKVARTDEERAAYARQVVDTLEYWVRAKGCTNIKWYCMTNELSLERWGALSSDLPLFKAYHEALYAELKRRKLDIGLLATDASPLEFWPTIDWAAKNMDGITAAYGGHHYINDRTPEDERFYPWFLGKLQWGADIARGKGKPFIMGEFGSKQDGRTINGVLNDACIYWGTEHEPMVGIQMAEAAIAAMNAGIHALGYWTFMDFPDNPASGYANKWGVFRCSGQDRSTRDLYYAFGLMTRFFRGPSAICAVETADPRLRVAAARHERTGAWAIAVVNRSKGPAPLALTVAGASAAGAFRKYVYDPARVPQSAFGDLQRPSGVVTMKSGKLADVVGPMTLTVYTTDYDTKPPAAVADVRLERAADGGVRLTWRASREADLCYYRVFRTDGANSAEVGTTVATGIALAPVGAPGARYAVAAVDQSGNEGPRTEAR